MTSLTDEKLRVIFSSPNLVSLALVVLHEIGSEAQRKL